MNLKIVLIVALLVPMIACRRGGGNGGRGGRDGKRLCKLFGDEDIGDEGTVEDFCNEMREDRKAFKMEQKNALKEKIREVCADNTFEGKKAKICKI